MTEWSRNNSDRVAEAWKNLSDAFGQRFLREYGDKAPPIWSNAIRSLKDHELARGMRKLSLHGSGSSPTLPQFMKACKTIGEDDGPSNPLPISHRIEGPQVDSFTRFANLRMLDFALKYDGMISDEQSRRMWTEKERLVKVYRDIDAEDRVTEEEFTAALTTAFTKIFAPVEQAA